MESSGNESLDEAMAQANAAVRGGGQRFVERLMERIGGVANAAAVFGDPVERNGVTVIPAARVAWGAGGGAGSGGEEKGGSGEGSGGGGGMNAKPVGYIEIRDGQARWVQFRDPGSFAPLVLASALGAWIVFRGMRALFR